MIWLDLETTGLDPESDLILEIGLIETQGPAMAEVRAQSWVIGYHNSVLERRCNRWAAKQHKASGLWHEVTIGRPSDPVWADVNRWLAACPAGDKPAMCGATIAFDRAFLRKHAPGIESLFHYRSLDVSAFRVLLPELGIECPPKREAHRALDDLRDSIALARHVSQLLRAGVYPVAQSE